MAMEHFDEKILPNLKHSIYTSVVSNVSSYESLMISHHGSNSKGSPLPHNFGVDKLNQAFKKIYSRTKKNKKTVLCVKGQISKMKLRMNRQSFQMRLQNLKLQEHTKKIQDQDAQLAEMRKHLEEWEQKLGDLTAELSRAREETQKSDTLENCKRKIADISVPCESNLLKTKDHQVKKRKLIIERKSSNDNQDIKFKKFMSELLADSSIGPYPSASH
jgi:chromosome segregation ATPase